MHIKWSSDISRQILHYMQEAEDGMEDCLNGARRATEMLGEAGLGSSATARRYERKMADLVNRMERCAGQIEDLIRGVRDTNERFESAERQITAGIESIATGAAAGGHAGSGRAFGSGSGAAGSYTGAEPAVNRYAAAADLVQLMPVMRFSPMSVVPQWLYQIAQNDSNFIDIFN